MMGFEDLIEKFERLFMAMLVLAVCGGLSVALGVVIAGLYVLKLAGWLP